MLKKYVILLSCLMLSTLLYAGGDQESAVSNRYEFDIEDFEGIDGSASFDIEVKRADDYSVIIYADKSVIEKLRIEKRGDTLHLGVKPFSSIPWKSSPKAVVTMPVLEHVDLSGASSMIAAGFQSTGNFTADLSGASSLELDLISSRTTLELSGASDLRAVLETGRIDLEISGSSDLELIGYGENLTADLSGASSGHLEDFLISEADIELSGSSDLHINLEGKLNIDASGASNLYYTGNVDLEDVDLSGASSLKKE